MKNAFKHSLLFILPLLTTWGCGKQEPVSIDIDIDIHEPAITTLSDGSKQLDFTVEVRQIGDYFHKDIEFELKKLGGSAVLDHYQTLMPTAKEFVHHSVVVETAGDYFLEVFVGSNGSGVGSGTLVKVPQ